MFSVNKFFISIRFKLSILKILLKNNILKSKIKIIIIEKNIKIKNINRIFKLIENLNISFEAIDVIYINKINIPPRKIKNKEYENQNVFVRIPVNSANIIVCVISKIPIERGWFIRENEKDKIINKKNITLCIISEQKIVYL